LSNALHRRKCCNEASSKAELQKKKKEIVERKAIPLGLAKLVVPHKMLGTVGEPQKALSLAWNAPSWSLGQGKAAAMVQQQCLDGRDASDASAARGSKGQQREEPPLERWGGSLKRESSFLKKEFSSLKKDWQGRG
jgi:hypothetical protein